MDLRRKGLLAGLAVAFVACQGLGLIHVKVSDDGSTTIPGSSGGGILDDLVSNLGFGGFTDLDVTASEELQNQGVQPGDISSARFTAFTLEAVDPEGADLSFLTSIDFFVESPGLPRILFASGEAFPAGVSSVDLTLEDVDLADYVVSQSMTITTEASGSLPDEDTTIEAHFTMDIGVTTQGACNALKHEGTKP